jgi:peptidoglycan/xylan/chitin deacetylase (PgdA/CDA1 family)
MRINMISKRTIRILFIGLMLTGIFGAALSWRMSRNVNSDIPIWRANIIKEADTKEKMIALTFDDGPSPSFTGKIMDLLKKYNAKGTFFIIAEQAEKWPELVKRQINEGHEIGNHMYSHREVFQMPIPEIKMDLEQSHRVIQSITGQQIRLYRPTSGYYNENIVGVAWSLEYLVVLWSIDSKDWSGLKPSSIARKILKAVKPGSIILFHDLGGYRDTTVKTLEIILPELARRGYRCLTVSQLLERAGHSFFTSKRD